MGSAGAPLLPAQLRAEREGSPERESREPGSFAELRDLTQGVRERAKVSHANEEGFLPGKLQGAQLSLEGVVVSLHTSQQGLKTSPISWKAALSPVLLCMAPVEIGDKPSDKHEQSPPC